MDNTPEKKIERMAHTIVTLKNKISTEKDFSRKMELKASLKRTIENFNKINEELEQKEFEDRLKRLKAPSKFKGGRKNKTHKNKTRKHKNKTQKREKRIKY